LRERARGEEFLDRPDSDPRLTEQSFRFMRVVNRTGGGIRVVRRFLARELSGYRRQDGTVLDPPATATFHPAVTRWETPEITCTTCLTDHNPKALDMARKAVRADCGTIMMEANILSTGSQAIRYAIGSWSSPFHG
jgi:hypothetical protein